MTSTETLVGKLQYISQQNIRNKINVKLKFTELPDMQITT